MRSRPAARGVAVRRRSPTAAVLVAAAALPCLAAFDPPFEKKVVPSPRIPGEQFAVSVAVDGSVSPSVLVAGAFGNDELKPDAGKAYVFVRDGARWDPADELFAPDADGSDRFGRSVTVDGDTLAVGAPRARAGAGTPTAGAVYVFERDAPGHTWSFHQKLVASDAADGDDFGWSVALEGDVLAVGALEKEGGRGAAYAFARDPATGVWSEQDRLIDPEGEAGDYLGISVDVDGDTIAVGAYRDTVETTAGPAQKGSVLLFTRSGVDWSFDQKVWSRGPSAGIEFGTSVALDDGELAAGAPADVPPFLPGQTPQGTGTVYRYDVTALDVMATQVRIWPSDKDEVGGPRQFGYALDLDGDVLAIGAHGDGSNGLDAGSLYLFDLDDGLLTESLKVTPADPNADDVFGFAVSVSGAEIAVGADRADIDPLADDNAGAAYSFLLPEPGPLASAAAALMALAALAPRGGASPQRESAS